MGNIQRYRSDGYCIEDVYTEAEFSFIQEFSIKWLNELFREFLGKEATSEDIKRYHTLQKEYDIPHQQILSAKNRHQSPSIKLKKLIINDRLAEILNEIGVKKIDLWDEGLGWLAFRLIRPSMGDGYPFSKKKWGPAEPVVSMWLPIVGFNKDVTLAMVPGSHKKEHQKYKDSNSIFNKDEYRLLSPPSEHEIFRPTLRKGQCILFDYSLLHSEDIQSGDSTRFNLEFRVRI